MEDLDAEATAGCAGPSGAGAGPSAGGAMAANAGPPGMRLYLSQIKEWYVECAADMLFIVIRTDCAWYKIASVHAAYSGWFEPILKVARLAVALLRMISGERRSSRLSFADLTRQLAGQDATLPTFISSKPASVRPHVESAHCRRRAA